MVGYEPSASEVRLTLLAGNTLLRPLYAAYVRSLGLKGDERVLDFGSGSGIMSRHLARALSNGGWLTCVDISRTWMDVIRQTLKGFSNVDYQCGDIRTLDIADHIYDAVFIHYVLHDLPPPDRLPVLVALARKLESGGRLYIREPTMPAHGLPAAGLSHLLDEAGFRQVALAEANVWLLGALVTGVFQK